MKKRYFQVLVLGAVAALVACTGVVTVEPEGAIAPIPELPAARVPDRTSAIVFPNRLPAPVPTSEAAVYTDVWDRLASGFQLQAFYSHPDVLAERKAFTGNQAYIERISSRAEPFLYLMLEELERRGLPSELLLLPFVESNFDPAAVSSQNAVGLWQIVKPTAVMLGLTIDEWYDGRRDPIASTQAALDYLETLYAQFNQNWMLAIAAYNAGEGTVRRALRQSREPEDFWSLPLPTETLSHVPRLLALAEVLAQPESHRVQLPPINNEPLLAAVNPGFQLDLSVAAATAGVATEVLRQYNPGFLQWATHPLEQHPLLIPASLSEDFYNRLDVLPADQRMAWERYKILPGDTLSSIALKFNTQVEALRRANGLDGSTIIAGRMLLIPGSGAPNTAEAIALLAMTDQASAVEPIQYRVRNGDNLWRIARRFDLRSQDIADWNKLDINAVLLPGQLLLLQDSNAGD